MDSIFFRIPAHRFRALNIFQWPENLQNLSANSQQHSSGLQLLLTEPFTGQFRNQKGIVVDQATYVILEIEQNDSFTNHLRTFFFAEFCET